ncbi:MAG: sigma 54-interacting transcriptional regulator [Erysipelotrichaceae bacterium]
MQKNEEKIYTALSTLQESTKELGVTTNRIAEHLEMDRTLVSRHLNQMVNNERIIKTGTRPVLYHTIIKKEIVDELDMDENEAESDAFDKLIGSHGSLHFSVEQCKSAVLYPNGGLPILITGLSGVGKSYLASLIFQYAQAEGIVDKNANFIIFNCADYANNAELLSSKLFGYKKGTFTGADDNNDGVIAQANGGYLFLDEVHRLSPEGQEKLFLLLDKGIYQRLGDKNYHEVKVRVICATTEDPKAALIDTFLRRIPITVHIPNFASRDLSERLELIQSFYALESRMFHKNIRVSKKVINFLLSNKFPGNIGEVKNIIKVSCANASRKSMEECVSVDIDDLSNDINRNIEIHDYFCDEVLEVKDQMQNHIQLNNHNCACVKETMSIINDINQCLKEYQHKHIEVEEMEKTIRLDVNRISDVLYFRNNISSQALYYTLFANHVESALKLLEKTYGLKYYGNTVKMISSILIAFSREKEFRNHDYVVLCRETLERLKQNNNLKYNFVTNRLLQYLADTFSFSYGVLEELYLTLYIYSMIANNNHNDINVVIVAHGYSTASSIASVVNQMHSNYIVESFDMPIDMEPLDIVKKINSYAKHLNKEKGTIFLVDMGSLFDIYSLVKDSFNGEVVVINNITTQLALAVGSMVNQGRSIIDIVDEVISNSEIKYKYYERKGKKKAIVTTCASGIGTAYKIRDMIKKCIVGNQQTIEIISCDYFTLKNMGKNSEIFKKYDVQLIITTLGLKVDDVPTMLFSDMFAAANEDKVREVFASLYDEENVDEIMNNLMKMLTLENVISRLIILNPNRVIDNVDAILNEVKQRFNINLDSNLKLTLYIHIAIMIERCMLAKGNQDSDEVKINTSQEKINLLRNIFDEKLIDFEVHVPDHELDMILRIIYEYDGKESITLDENE